MNILSIFKKKESKQQRTAALSTKRKKYSDLNYGSYSVGYGNKSSLYRFMRDHIPIISSAVWSWVRLCNTSGNYQLIGAEKDIKHAQIALQGLFKRLNTVVGNQRNGIGYLLELFFVEVFTCGSFSGNLKPLASGKGIDHFCEIDGGQIEWKKKGKWIPYLVKDDKRYSLEKEMFFHYGLGADIHQPEGTSFMSSIEFVSEIEQKMVADMAKSSHNAGTPHLHIKVKPPEKFENESDTKYVNRANKYFENTVKSFDQLNAEDNFFTYSDIEISVIGGSGSMSSTWKLNREQVIEDVITGMKLFPWVVGRSHGTTKNWVQAQFNLLMQVVDSIQEEGKAFAEWIMNTELELRNIPVKAIYNFSPNQDPFIVEKENAKATKFDTIDKKVSRGYISKDDGAKELGYEGAYKEDNPEIE